MAPPRSKLQAKFMRAIASGTAKAPGLSKKEASEYVSGYSTKNLPTKVSRYSKLKKKLKG